MVRYLIGDVFERMAELPDESVDLVLTSPPFLALRSYLPADHPGKDKEIGSEATPAEFIDVMLQLTAEWRRLLTPHGSICVELGDTYSGSGGAGGDYGDDGLREGQPKFRQGGLAKYADSRGNPDGMRDPTFSGANTLTGGGTGWPLAKSLTLVPESYRFALAYGINPHTGAESPAGRWRVRNIIRWVRPNPPVGALGDKFRPATSELVVACVSDKRWFDLDAVRHDNPRSQEFSRTRAQMNRGAPGYHTGDDQTNAMQNPAGAPPLDWWKISPKGYSGAHYAVWPAELCVKPIKAMCPPFVCLDCGVALGLSYDQPGSAEPLRGMWGRDSSDMGQMAGRRQESQVLFQDVRESSYSQEPLLDERLRHYVEGLQSSTQTIPPNGGSDGIRHGTSVTDSGEDRTQPRIVGGRPSQEWDQGRQSDSESRTADQNPARPDAETRPGTPPLSVVRQSDPNSPQCSACEGHNLRRGRVLDPFAGTGTTLAVAHGHGRDAIGIDLDERNAELARDRVGPLFLDVVASDDALRMSQ
jgi:hypothetical protein